ncbi:hypothetical protein PVK06_024007 [Gossypium arboreum]|uniref:Uncharacterized protein n=1 Tax=Gossypium arboreum TaxID=29729 RepID=A0ABR0PCN7_GOSAR|nr:hypothetical protein PVK06_024007 [Gossypium arboreum]
MGLLIELNEQFNKIVDISPSMKRLLTIYGILCIPTCIQLLLLFRDKHETFDTPQAQRARKQMNLAEWWIIYGTCVPKLQN